MGFTEKSNFYRGSLKTSIEAGLPKKARLGKFADLRMGGGGGGGLARKREIMFLRRVDTPMHIM